MTTQKELVVFAYVLSTFAMLGSDWSALVTG